MGSTQVVLVRHGESTGNVARERAEDAQAEVIDIDLRDASVPLSELGHRQAATLRPVLRDDPPDHVWSSPYVRAVQTAQEAIDVAPRLDERLRDRELGILDRLTGRGIRARFPEEADRRRHLGKFYYRPPGGESWADVALRLRSFLAELPPGRHLVFSHDAVVVLVRYVLEGLDEEQALDLGRTETVPNASITVLERRDPTSADGGGRDGVARDGVSGSGATGGAADGVGAWTCLRHGDASHLGDLATEHPATAEPPTGAGARG